METDFAELSMTSGKHEAAVSLWDTAGNGPVVHLINTVITPPVTLTTAAKHW